MRKLLTTLVVLAVLLLALDRGGAYVAGRVVADRLKTDAALARTPSVHITGFPFLTQAASGVYDDVELTATDVDRGGVRLQRIAVSLRGVHLALGAITSGSVQRVPVDAVSARVVVAYAAVQDEARTKGLTVRPEGRRVRVTGRITVLGQTVMASATSSVRLDKGDLVLTAGEVSVEGVATSALAGRLDLRVPVGRLPYGLRLTGVTVTPAGLVVTARSGPTVLMAGSALRPPALHQP